jgi:hypothetical protein
VYGVYNVSQIKIYSESNMRMAVVSEPGVIRRQNNRTDENLEFVLYLSPCRIGDAQIIEETNYVCRLCARGTYLLRAPREKEELKCKICPQRKAMCLSGAKIGPEEGYWRKDNYTDTFLRCFEGNASCISLFRNKTTSANYSATGNCAPGYYGALCTACLPGYKRYE